MYILCRVRHTRLPSVLRERQNVWERRSEVHFSSRRATDQATYECLEQRLLHCPQCVCVCVLRRGGGLGSSTIFKKFNESYAPS